MPLLSAEEEIELAKRMELGDQEAKKRLAEANLRLVVSIGQMFLLTKMIIRWMFLESVPIWSNPLDIGFRQWA